MKKDQIISRLFSHRTANFPYTVERNHLRFFPTQYGLLFIVILLAMLMGSINYNNNFGFLLTFLIGSMMLISILHSVQNLSGLQFISWDAKPNFAGEDAVFEILIRSQGAIRQGIRFQFLEGEEQQYDFDDQVGGERWVKLTKKTSQRGKFHPGNLIVSTTYPMGLFYVFILIDFNLETLVYPRPIRAHFNTHHISNKTQQDSGIEGGKGADDFLGLRNYQPGDPIRHIAWKAFSRGQGLQTKDFVQVFGATVLLTWDSLNDPETEVRLSKLCDMVIQAHSLRLVYGLHIPGHTIPPDQGEAHKHRCLKTLALF